MNNVQIFIVIYLFVLAPLISIKLMQWKYLQDKPHLSYLLSVVFFVSSLPCLIPYSIIYGLYHEISGAIKEIRR